MESCRICEREVIMQTEIWKKYPEIVWVEVSTLGRVRTLDRVVPSKGNGTQLVKGRILKQRDNGRGYLQVSFHMNGKAITKNVHRLIAETFIPNPYNLPEVNHRDCDRANNNVENLEFCTRSYNRQYREKYGVSQTEASGHPLFAINLSTMEVLHFRSQHEAGRELGIFYPHINAVIKGRYKYTHGFWFVNDDDKATDAIKNKLHKICKRR